MAEPIILPKAGLTMDEGKVSIWLVAVGESVSAGQPVVEIDTYKATIELEATIDGILRAAIDAGDTVPVGTIIGIIADADENIDHLELGAPAADEERSGAGASRTSTGPLEPSAAVSAPSPSGPPRAEVEGSVSPAARRRARELGVDLSAVTGTGPAGRVRVEDVERSAGGDATS